MDITHVIKRLRAVGAEVSLGGAHDLTVDGKIIQVKGFHRTPTPSDLRNILAHTTNAGAVLLMLDKPAPSLRERALKDPRFALVFGDEVILWGEARSLDDRKVPVKGAKGPKPYARFAVGRAALAVTDPARQSELADLAGVTQGSASNALRAWSGLLDVSGRPTDVGQLFDRLVDEYPGPGGTSVYWWSDRPVREQSEELRRLGALLSGDAAASAIRGWRVPEHAIAYGREPLDLSALGYVLADADDYTTQVTVPTDMTLWATAHAHGRDVADPAITAYDVLRTGTTGDEGEAVQAIRADVIDRHHGE